MIYLDNSATTYKKPKSVYRAFWDGITKYSANPGRSGHKISIEVAEKIFNVRQDVSDFVQNDNVEKIIFTSNCTEALNYAILGSFISGGHIICSVNDHNAISRPLTELKNRGLEISVAKTKSHILTREDIEPLIKPNTYMIALNHCSNVNGDIADIKSIGELCAEKCLLFVVDGAQSAGHLNINMQKNHIDMLALAPHKGLYSPQGVGVLCLSSRAKLSPIKFGGTGTESFSTNQPTTLPEALESGTLATPNILALAEGLKFVKNNFNIINERITELGMYVLFELDKIENVTTYTHHDNAKNGVIAFNIGNYDSGYISELLSEKYGIATRGGLHCAPLKHENLGTMEQGVVRASISYYNTFGECEKFVKAVKEIAQNH